MNSFSFNQIKRVAGVSAGAITALLVALDCLTPRELSKYSINLNLNQLKGDDGCCCPRYKSASRAYCDYGIHDNVDLLHFIENIIEEKTGDKHFTFGDLKKKGYKDLYVITTIAYIKDGVATSEPFVFCYENAANTPIAYAVLASAMIPSFFACVRLSEITKGRFILDNNGHAFVDGGVFSTAVPLRIFDHPCFQDEEKDDKDISQDLKETRQMVRELREMAKSTLLPRPYICKLPEKSEILSREEQQKSKIVSKDNYNNQETRFCNPQTLGFQLDEHEKKDSPCKIEIIPKSKPYIMGSAIIHGVSFRQREHVLDSLDEARTVSVDRKDVRAVDFEISQAKKEELILSGKKAVEDYFQRHKTLNKKIDSKLIKNQFITFREEKHNNQLKPVKELSIWKKSQTTKQTSSLLKQSENSYHIPKAKKKEVSMNSLQILSNKLKKYQNNADVLTQKMAKLIEYLYVRQSETGTYCFGYTLDDFNVRQLIIEKLMDYMETFKMHSKKEGKVVYLQAMKGEIEVALENPSIKGRLLWSSHRFADQLIEFRKAIDVTLPTLSVKPMKKN